MVPSGDGGVEDAVQVFHRANAGTADFVVMFSGLNEGQLLFSGTQEYC